MKKAVLIVFGMLSLCITRAQSNASYKNEINAFLKQDSLQFPPKDAIEFVGSSSIRKWTDIQAYFPGYTIINRGFGGSQLFNVDYYADKIIYPYHPKQVLIYCGDNDFAYDTSLSVQIVFERFKKLFKGIRSHLPNANIGYIAIKYSPSRKSLFGKMKEMNRKANEFLRHQPNAEFINTNIGMLDKEGKIDQSIYQSDLLHLNAEGYKIWQKIIKPYLLK